MTLFTLQFNLLDDLFQKEIHPVKNHGKRLFGEATGCVEVCLLCVNDFSKGKGKKKKKKKLPWILV